MNKEPTQAEKRSTAKEIRAEALKTFSNLLTAAFGLVAALAWNEAVKDAINRYISPGEGLRSKFIYAIFVTLLAVLVSYQFSKFAAQENSQGKKK